MIVDDYGNRVIDDYSNVVVAFSDGAAMQLALRPPGSLWVELTSGSVEGTWSMTTYMNVTDAVMAAVTSMTFEVNFDSSDHLWLNFFDASDQPLASMQLPDLGSVVVTGNASVSNDVLVVFLRRHAESVSYATVTDTPVIIQRTSGLITGDY